MEFYHYDRNLAEIIRKFGPNLGFPATSISGLLTDDKQKILKAISGRASHLSDEIEAFALKKLHKIRTEIKTRLVDDVILDVSLTTFCKTIGKKEAGDDFVMPSLDYRRHVPYSDGNYKYFDRAHSMLFIETNILNHLDVDTPIASDDFENDAYFTDIERCINRVDDVILSFKNPSEIEFDKSNEKKQLLMGIVQSNVDVMKITDHLVPPEKNMFLVRAASRTFKFPIMIMDVSIGERVYSDDAEDEGKCNYFRFYLIQRPDTQVLDVIYLGYGAMKGNIVNGFGNYDGSAVNIFLKSLFK